MSFAHHGGLPSTRVVSAGMVSLAADFGFSAVAPHEFEAVHQMASRLMLHQVATADTFREVQAIQPASAFAFREGGEVTAILGVLLLRPAAATLLMQGQFDGVDVDTALLSRANETPAIGYGWGIAASTKRGGAAISAVSMPLRNGPLASIDFVTRAVTPVGRHVSLTRFGYVPLRHRDDDLLISLATAKEAAA